jgi:hypothetical protein
MNIFFILLQKNFCCHCRLTFRVVELYHFDAATALSENCYVAPAPTLLQYGQGQLKQTKVNFRVRAILSSDFYRFQLL